MPEICFKIIMGGWEVGVSQQIGHVDDDDDDDDDYYYYYYY